MERLPFILTVLCTFSMNANANSSQACDVVLVAPARPQNLEGLAIRRAAIADPDAELAALLKRAIDAAGGEAMLQKIKAIRCKSKGILHSADEKASYDAEWTYSGHRQLRFTAIYEKNPRQRLKLVEVINGDQAWASINDGPAEAMAEGEASARRETMYVNWLLTLVPLKGKEFRLKLLPDRMTAKRAVLGIEVSHAAHDPVTLFLDKESNLVVGVQRRIKEEGRELSQEIEFSDFKVVQGLKLPFRSLYRHDRRLAAQDEIHDLTILENIEPGVFAKP